MMSLGGQPLMSARSVRENFANAGVDVPGGCNSFSCPIGEEFGRGDLLMSRGALNQMQGVDGAFLLKLGLGNQIQTFTTYLVRAQRLCVMGTQSQDSDSVYWVEVADRRWILARKHADLRYNVRLPKSHGYAYIKNTLQDGNTTPWTWQQVIQDLWQRLNIGAFTWVAPSPTLQSTPQNLRFENMSLWHALNDACRRCGLVVRYQAIEDQFSLVQAGSGAADSTTAKLFNFANQGGVGDSVGIQSGKTQRTPGDYLLTDSETILGVNFVPGSVVVAFPSMFGDEAQYLAYGRFTYVSIAVNTLGLAAKYTPQTLALEETIYDATPAQYSTTGINFAILPSRTNPTPTNLSDLQQRAKERATDYIRAIVDDCDAEITKSGIWNLPTSPTITEVIWHDYGDHRGMCTTLKREPLAQNPEDFPHHEQVRHRINCTLTQDLVRGGSATATVNDIAPLTETITVYDDLPIITSNTVYNIVFTGTITAGSWKLTVNGNNITVPWNTVNDDLTSDVNNVLGDGSVVVTGGPSPVNLTLEFVGQYANTTVTVAADGTNLTGGGGASAAVATAVTKGNTICSGAKVYGEWYDALLHYQIDGWQC